MTGSGNDRLDRWDDDRRGTTTCAARPPPRRARRAVRTAMLVPPSRRADANYRPGRCRSPTPPGSGDGVTFEISAQCAGPDRGLPRITEKESVMSFLDKAKDKAEETRGR